MASRTIRLASRGLMRGKVDLTVIGQDLVPVSGPVVLAARHYHHLFDGTSIVTTLSRPVKVMVALDWVTAGPQRRLAELLCGVAGWPVVLRPDADRYRPELAADPARRAAYERDTTRYLMRAASQSVEILRRGEALLMFPEGYPNIDPSFTPKGEDNDDFLPTLPGAVRIPLLAQAAGLPVIPIVPVGLYYRRTGKDAWAIRLRFGQPLRVAHRREANQSVQRLGAEIRLLSAAEGD
jgi:hypothetical protein